MDENTLRSILFSTNKNNEFITQLNIVLKQLIDEDAKYAGGNKIAPSIWECKWLNKQSGSTGYPKGHAVWLNTNTYDQMVAWHQNAIKSYVTNNAILNTMYGQIDKHDSNALNQFFLSVANGTASPNVSAMYYLGNTISSVQVRISKIDDNRDYPSADTWKDFYSYASYDDNVQLMLSAAVSCIDDAIYKHVQDYHLSNNADAAQLNARGFVKRYPFELSNVQTQQFYDHNYCNQMEGFDFVKRWKMARDGSSWCRIWNSGYVEQGGFVYNIPGEALIPVEFMTTYNYPPGATFYQRDYQTYDTSYQIDNPLQANNRYIVTITPMLEYGHAPYPSKPINVGNELLYSSVDVTNMSNHGFSIVNTDILAERYVKYTWHVCGYKVIEQDSQMFDNKQLSQAIAEAFSIENGNLYAFQNAGYSQVVVPNGVSSIGNSVFSDQTSIKTFILPNGLNTIEDEAFARCAMQGIALPNSTTYIGNEAFKDCKFLAYVAFGPNVKEVGTSAFCGDDKLMNVSRLNDTDPGHTFDIVGDCAFYGASLKKANLALRSSSIYTFWGDYCFAENKSLEEVNFLSSCYMSTGMFKGCTKLKDVNFKNNHTSYVYPSVFEGCTALSTITLPSKIWYISENMFKNCSGLKTVSFNTYDASDSSINLIQKNAFNGCTSMKSLSLPASLTSISMLDDACLSGCALTSITFHGIDYDQITRQSGTSRVLVDAILSSGMFRLNHNCTIACKDGQIARYIYDASKIRPYVQPVDYTSRVDKTTTSGFKTASELKPEGKFWWYYNARQLKAQADRDHNPCLFIWSLLGCNPCQIYEKNIFNNKQFQDWCAKQKFYLCGLEVEKQPYYDSQLAFCRDVLEPAAQNVFGNQQDFATAQATGIGTNALGNAYYIQETTSGTNSNLLTPVLIFYHKKADGTTISMAHTFHNISQYIQKFGVEGTIELVKRLCLYYFENNNTDSHTYVEDVDTAFDKQWYIGELDSNPYASSTEPFVIIPRKSDEEGSEVLTTVDAVNADILRRYAEYFGTNDYTDPSHITEYSVVDDNGNIYLGGCGADSIGYISYTFDGIEDLDPTEMATLINTGNNANYRFKIGNDYYKLQVDANHVREVYSPCTEPPYATGAMISWNKTS